ncbi:MAG: hypothetical protein ACE5PV_09145 [Candidatus Poribacteria bacterium]
MVYGSFPYTSESLVEAIRSKNLPHSCVQSFSVDWVKLSGEEVKAIESLNKLAATWGEIKADF